MKNIALRVLFFLMLCPLGVFSSPKEKDQKERQADSSFCDFSKYYNLYKRHISVLMDSAKYAEAIPYLVQSVRYNPIMYGNMAICYMQIGDKEKALEFGLKSFDNGYKLNYYDSDIFPSEIWNVFKARYDSLDLLGKIEKNEDEVDSQAIQLFTKLNNADQNIRNEYNRLSKTAPSSTLDSLVKEMNFIDANNMASLNDYVKEFGWPDARTFGNSTYQPNILLVHSDLIHCMYYMPLLKQAALNGKMDWTGVMSVMYHLTFRQQSYDGKTKQNKLLYTYLENKQALDEKRSMLQLYTIANILYDNPYLSIQLYSYGNANLPASKSKLALEKIKNIICETGIDSKRIEILADTQHCRKEFLPQFDVPFGMYIKYSGEIR